MDIKEQAMEIYRAYPRKVGRGAALPKIRAALERGVPYETLLERTRKFADLTSDKSKKYIPHPATWYGQERYADDEREWSRHREADPADHVSTPGPSHDRPRSLPLEIRPWQIQHPVQECLERAREAALEPAYEPIFAMASRQYRDDPERLQRVLATMGDAVLLLEEEKKVPF
jgi:hypothetical protein